MEMIPLQVDVTGIIMEGTRRVDEWSRIREVIPHEVMIPIDGETIPPADLDEVGRTIVKAIDGKRTIAEIELETRSSVFLVCSRCTTRAGRLHQLKEPVGSQTVGQKALAPRVSGAIPAVIETEMTRSRRFSPRTAGAPQRAITRSQRLLKAAENLDPNHPKVRSAVQGRRGGHPDGSAQLRASPTAGPSRGEVDRRDHHDELHAERGLHPVAHQRTRGTSARS